ncbi:MAG: hypothetical protein E6176_07595 [Clostridium celatum]|uniref:hypothetical protein n=1 Tax=uncultured Clostridium sp. TaxID=59620 RepID=UPI0025E5633F|nr:hypothetical protein [uncultured Clostridium sp.]MDU4884719.1 hypothetical protein [Clostridium celatum]MDU5262276.1 hypothetical protein [Clostridium celatum]MDU7077943.1 hypothetical protein [Clostridium celatum]
MKKDILDKLELKNYENLSSNRMNDSILGISRDLDHLKINDDFSNDELIEDEFSIIESNFYIDLSDVIENNKINNNDKDKVDISALPLENNSNGD